MNATQRILAVINSNLVSNGAKPLFEYIQGNNFSGLVSNIFCDAMHDHSPYKHNSHQAYPDLVNPQIVEQGKPAGLEVKSTIQVGKGGESHKGTQAGTPLRVTALTGRPATSNSYISCSPS